MTITKKKPRGRPRKKASNKTSASNKTVKRETAKRETLIERAERIKLLWFAKGYCGAVSVFNINAMIRAYKSGDYPDDLVERLKDIREPG